MTFLLGCLILSKMPDLSLAILSSLVKFSGTLKIAEKVRASSDKKAPAKFFDSLITSFGRGISTLLS